MKIYLIEDNREGIRWDWNGSVVIAENEEEALKMHYGKEGCVSIKEIGISHSDTKQVILESWSG